MLKREESNLRFPGYQPGALTAVLRQGKKYSGRNSNPQRLLRRQLICPVNRPEYEQGLPGSNRRLRFWRPLCFRLHQAPLKHPRQGARDPVDLGFAPTEAERRPRTSGLVIPNHALPQLSYIPKKCPTRGAEAPVELRLAPTVTKRRL